jgi:hypothetical protein
MEVERITIMDEDLKEAVIWLYGESTIYESESQ